MSAIVSTSSAAMVAKYSQMSMGAKTQISLLQKEIDQTLQDIEAIRQSGMGAGAAQKLIDVKIQLILIYQSRVAMIKSRQAAQEGKTDKNNTAEQEGNTQTDAASVISHIAPLDDDMLADSMDTADGSAWHGQLPPDGSADSAYRSINEYV